MSQTGDFHRSICFKNGVAVVFFFPSVDVKFLSDAIVSEGPETFKQELLFHVRGNKSSTLQHACLAVPHMLQEKKRCIISFWCQLAHLTTGPFL